MKLFANINGNEGLLSIYPDSGLIVQANTDQHENAKSCLLLPPQEYLWRLALQLEVCCSVLRCVNWSSFGNCHSNL
jgi:hypothetical protein